MGFIAKACKCKSDRVRYKIVWLSQIFAFIRNLVFIFFILGLRQIDIHLKFAPGREPQLIYMIYLFTKGLIERGKFI